VLLLLTVVGVMPPGQLEDCGPLPPLFAHSVVVLVVVCFVNPPFGFVVLVVVVVVCLGAKAFAICIKGVDVTSAAIATIMAVAIIIVFVSIKDYYEICSIRRLCDFFPRKLPKIVSW